MNYSIYFKRLFFFIKPAAVLPLSLNAFFITGDFEFKKPAHILSVERIAANKKADEKFALLHLYFFSPILVYYQ